MNRFVCLFVVLLSLCAASSAEEKKRYVLYAMFTDNTAVRLADGAKWMMDKGDTFPVVMFKEQQTKVILQLAGTSFMVGAEAVKVVEEKDLTNAQLETYRQNVKNYIESSSDKWIQRAK